MPVKSNMCTMPVKEEYFDNEFDYTTSSFIDSIYLDGVEFTDYPVSEFNTIPPDAGVTDGMLTTESANPYICTYFTQDLNKYQIRNHDCMWSGRCGEHPEKSKNNSKLNNSGNNNNNKCSKGNINNNKVNNVIINNNNNNNKITSQHIQPGDSLLRNNNNSNINNSYSGSNNNNVNSKAPKLPNISTNDFLKERETYNASNIVRPETPSSSMDDDPPTFKHNIDLAACTMGSNNMCLVNPEEISSARIINLLKEHFEDTSSEVMPKPLLSRHCKTESLSDILKTLHELKEIPNYVDEDEAEIVEEEDDDDEDEEEDLNSNHDEDDINGDSDSESNYSIHNSNNNNNSIGNHNNNSLTTMTNGSATNQHIKLEFQATHDGDHCYTRTKNRVDPAPLGVQTPSDSEEEIDVVSVGDKTLPTNPSARDRRALQTTVAVKIKTARMEKTPRGMKGGQTRRQYSEEDSFTSSCHSTPTKLNQTISFTGGNAIQCTDITSSRKRSHPSKDLSGNTSSSSSSSGGTKRHRGKKNKSPGKRQTSDSDEADTIEKRNLHNDMERQRRIGLKNLFEELKCQIPNIKDKERAPKVSILREAAALCNKLNREQEQLAQLKKTQQRLMNRVKVLRTSLASQWG